jgi:oxygen-independent coproporphyrinogen-3 oxidase
MYRQKHMMGNLENTGYAKTGFECIYNIDIMEETTSILAFGAGSITKKVLQKENRIERAPNVSDLLHYLSRYKEMAERKIKLFKA